MVRFIFFCMAVLALSVAAIPLTNVIDGIAKERAETLAAATLATPAQPDPDYFAADDTAAPAEDQLNAIETAAGGAEGALEDTSEIRGGFRDGTPQALADDPIIPASVPAPQDN